jgi:predicted enzyme related to lactoylglutathione lyase
VQSQVLDHLPMQKWRKAESAMNSLDPRAKRFRVADRSLQQAKGALQGAQLALADLPRSSHSPITSALDSIDHALSHIAAAGGQIDEARLDDSEQLA